MTQYSPKTPDSPRAVAIAWVVRLHSGRLTLEERAALRRWLAEDTAHREAFAAARAAWEALPPPPAELAAARAATPAAPARRQRLALGALAAAILLAIGSAEGWPPLLESEIRTAKGEHRSVDLPDGSRLELGADSVARVQYRWNLRGIELVRGEAFFDVGETRFRPFEVAAGGARLRDIGTRFDVRLKPEETELTVLNGAVRLQLDAAAVVREVRGGETAAYARTALRAEPHPADLAAATAWREGRLVFRAEPLPAVLAELARHHPLEFRLADPALARLKLSGTFSTQDLPLFLTTLEATLPVKARRSGHTVVLEKSR